VPINPNKGGARATVLPLEVDRLVVRLAKQEHRSVSAMIYLLVREVLTARRSRPGGAS
jgi:hypothetical protein